MLYAPLLNKKFEPRKSFVAIGSICEPLDFPEYTKSFLEEMTKLGNPTQISTKEVNYDLARVLKKVGALVSMCSAQEEVCRKHEPNRPHPIERLDFRREIRGSVFLRPILPSVSFNDYCKSIEIIADYTDGIILGNLRLTDGVKRKLGVSALPKKYFEVKERLENYAKELGLIVYRSARCSNAYRHDVICWNKCWEKGFCSSCPNRCREKV